MGRSRWGAFSPLPYKKLFQWSSSAQVAGAILDRGPFEDCPCCNHVRMRHLAPVHRLPYPNPIPLRRRVYSRLGACACGELPRPAGSLAPAPEGDVCSEVDDWGRHTSTGRGAPGRGAQAAAPCGCVRATPSQSRPGFEMDLRRSPLASDSGWAQLS